MQKKLTKIGNSYGIVLDKAILDLLHIEPETILNLELNGSELVIRPETSKKEESRKEKLKASSQKMLKAHKETYRKLAE